MASSAIPVTRFDRMTDIGIDCRDIAGQHSRLPLISVAADEAIEVLEAHSCRPLIKRPRLAGRIGRRVVVLAEPGRAIAILEKNTADCCGVLSDDAVIAGESGGLLRDHAKSCGVVLRPVIRAARVGEQSEVE